AEQDSRHSHARGIIEKEFKRYGCGCNKIFRGIKLGAGGLIRAYSQATSLALQTTGIVKRTLMQGMSVTVQYPLLGKIKNMLDTSDYILDTIRYLENVEFSVYVPKGEENTFREWMTNATRDQAEITTTQTAYVEKEVSDT